MRLLLQALLLADIPEHSRECSGMSPEWFRAHLVTFQPHISYLRVSGDPPGQQIASGDCPVLVVKERAQPNLA